MHFYIPKTAAINVIVKPILFYARQAFTIPTILSRSLDELSKGTVDGRAQRLDILVKLDRLSGTLGDAFWGELKLL